MKKCKDCEWFAEIKGFGMNSCKKNHRYITKSDNCGFGTEGCPKWCPTAIQSSKGMEQKGIGKTMKATDKFLVFFPLEIGGDYIAIAACDKDGHLSPYYGTKLENIVKSIVPEYNGDCICKVSNFQMCQLVNIPGALITKEVDLFLEENGECCVATDWDANGNFDMSRLYPRSESIIEEYDGKQYFTGKFKYIRSGKEPISHAELANLLNAQVGGTPVCVMDDNGIRKEIVWKGASYPSALSLENFLRRDIEVLRHSISEVARMHGDCTDIALSEDGYIMLCDF